MFSPLVYSWLPGLPSGWFPPWAVSQHTHGVALAQPRWCLGSLPPLCFGFLGMPPAVSPPAGFGCRQQVGFPMCGVPPAPAQVGPWWFSCCFCFSLSLPPLLLDWGARGLAGLVGGWGVHDFAGAPRVGWVGWRPMAGLWWAPHKPVPLLRCGGSILSRRWVSPDVSWDPTPFPTLLTPTPLSPRSPSGY